MGYDKPTKSRSSSKSTQLALNVRLLVISLVILVTLGVSSFFWHGYQQKNISDALLTRANNLESEEKFTKSATYLYRYLEYQPEDHEARIRLARNFGKAAVGVRLNRAVKLYYGAIAVADDEQRIELRKELVPMLLFLNRGGEANKESQAYRDTVTNRAVDKELTDEEEKKNDENIREAEKFLARSRFLIYLTTGDFLDPEEKDRRTLIKAVDDARELNRGELDLTMKLATLLRSEDNLLVDLEKLKSEYPDDNVNADWPNNKADQVIDEMVDRISQAKDQLENGEKQESTEFSQFTRSELKKLLAEAYLQRFGFKVRTDRADKAGDDINDALTLVNEVADRLKNAELELAKAKASKKEDLNLYEQELAAAEKDFDEIKDVSEQVKLAFGQFILERVDKGAFKSSLAKEKLADAVRQFESVLDELNEKNILAYEGLATAYKALGNVETLIERCRKGLNIIGKDDVQINALLCDAYLTKGAEEDIKQAQAYFEQLRKNVINFSRDSSNDPRQVAMYFRNLRLFDARIMMALGDAEGAIALINQAELEFASEGKLKAETLKFLAAAYGAAGKTDQEAQILEQASIANPKSSGEYQQRAALAWARAGQTGKAISAYRRLAASTSSPQVKLTYARLLFNRQVRLPAGSREWAEFVIAFEDAENAALVEKLDEPWQLAFLKIESEIAIQDWDKSKVENDSKGFAELKKKLEKLEADYGNQQPVVRGLIFIYEMFGLADEADRLLAKYEDLEPKEVDRLVARTDLLTRRQEFSKAKDLLKSGIGKLPAGDRPLAVSRMVNLVRQVVAENENSNDSFEETIRALEGVEIKDVRTLRLLADQALDEAKIAKAKELEDKLVEIEGETGTYWRYCRIRRLLEDKDAQGYVDESNLVEADKLRTELQRLRPSWPLTHLLKGRYLHEYAKRNDYPESNTKSALAAYKTAQSMGVNSLWLNREIVLLLRRLGEINEAEQLFSELGTRTNDSIGLSALEMLNAYDLKDFDRAESLAEANVKRWPENSEARTWYGNILRINQKNDLALKEFQTAVDLAPDKRESWSALFGHYVKTNDLQKANETLNKMVQQLEINDSEKAYLLAQGFEMLNRDRDAAIQYDRAVELAAELKLIEKEIPYHRGRAKFYSSRDITLEAESLAKIIEKTRENEAETNRLALILFMQGKTSQWQELLNSSKSREANSLKIRLTAKLLSERNSPSARKQAIEIFEKAIKESSGGADGRLDRFNLAKLYIVSARAIELSDDEKQELLEQSRSQTSLSDDELKALSNEAALKTDLSDEEKKEWLAQEQKRRTEEKPQKWFEEEQEKLLDKKRKPLRDKAEEQLFNIVSVSKPNFEHVRYFVQYLLENDRTKEAERWLNQVDLMSVNGLYALKLRGNLLKLQERFDEFAPLVEKIAIQRQREIVDNEVYADIEKDRLMLNWAIRVGALYTDFALYQPAEKWLRMGAKKKPDGFSFLAYNLGMQGRVDEAIDICLAEKANTESTLPGVVIANLLTQYKVSPAKLKEAQGAIDQVIKENEGDTGLLMAVGDMHAVNQDVAAAIKYYENVLKENDKHVIALNNLATLYSEIPDKRQKALEYIERAIRVSGKRPAWLDTEGMIYLLMGNKSEAIKRLEQAAATQVDPRHKFHLAVAYHENGDAAKAKQSFEEALNQDLESAILTGNDQQYLTMLKKQYGF